jgi:hypothetical protein
MAPARVASQGRDYQAWPDPQCGHETDAVTADVKAAPQPQR